MKIIYLLIIFFYSSVSFANDKKCTWNLVKSNCKTKEISNKLGSFLKDKTKIAKDKTIKTKETIAKKSIKAKNNIEKKNLKEITKLYGKIEKYLK